MAIIRWRPLDEELDKFFEHFHTHASTDLAVDLYDEDDSIVAKVSLAGINPEKVDISVDDNLLRISGEREEDKEVEDKNYYYKEIRRGSFERIIPLPTAVVAEKTKAEMHDGILKIYLPKKKAVQASKVKIERKK